MWRTHPTAIGGRFDVPRWRQAQARDEVIDREDGAFATRAIHRPIDVPDLVGMTSQDARRCARMGEPGVVVEARPVANGLRGRVFRQRPEAGALSSPGDVVTVYVGTGPEVAVPDVRGADEQDSLARLLAAGLSPSRRVLRRSSSVAQGSVVPTRPRAGTVVPAGTPVTIVVVAPPRPDRSATRRVVRRQRVRRLPDGTFLSNA